jgi:hypothetical protein
MDEKKKQDYNKGLVILLLLATLTIGEYFIGSVASAWWAPLLAVAVLKAFLIMRDYMHIGRLFAGEEIEE